MTAPDNDTPLTMREALRQIWLADKYPILGNGDVEVAEEMDALALEMVAKAMPQTGDPPEFAQWVAILCNPQVPGIVREEVMFAIHDLFEPE